MVHLTWPTLCALSVEAQCNVYLWLIYRECQAIVCMSKLTTHFYWWRLATVTGYAVKISRSILRDVIDHSTSRSELLPGIPPQPARSGAMYASANKFVANFTRSGTPYIFYDFDHAGAFHLGVWSKIYPAKTRFRRRIAENHFVTVVSAHWQLIQIDGCIITGLVHFLISICWRCHQSPDAPANEIWIPWRTASTIAIKSIYRVWPADEQRANFSAPWYLQMMEVGPVRVQWNGVIKQK